VEHQCTVQNQSVIAWRGIFEMAESCIHTACIGIKLNDLTRSVILFFSLSLDII
jgi:hypothetical protein